jgi:hypothetical protein
MYRIDENTYIDDSLVTCAEYQLFIDEMREQGKHYQPDHWTSYQFPSGQARMLILGVRQSDAKAFCEWLTQRKAGEWQYRLPKSEEAKEYPLSSVTLSPLGYWTDEDTDNQFAWVEPVPTNPRGLDFDRILDILLVRAIDLDHTIDLNLDRALDLDHDRNFALNLAGDLTHAIDIDLDFDFNRALDRARDVATDIIHTLDHALDRNRDHTLNLNLDFNLNVDLARVREFARDLKIDFARNRALALAGAFIIVLRILFDLVTLQERIAGRSPAFEGIRIIKERVE